MAPDLEYSPQTLQELSDESALPIAKLKEIEDALLAKQQVILTGPPGTSKTYIAQLFAKYFVGPRDGHSQAYRAFSGDFLDGSVVGPLAEEAARCVAQSGLLGFIATFHLTICPHRFGMTHLPDIR